MQPWGRRLFFWDSGPGSHYIAAHCFRLPTFTAQTYLYLFSDIETNAVGPRLHISNLMIFTAADRQTTDFSDAAADRQGTDASFFLSFVKKTPPVLDCIYWNSLIVTAAASQPASQPARQILLVVLIGFGWFWLVLVGFGWCCFGWFCFGWFWRFWLVLVGFGWFWMVLSGLVGPVLSRSWDAWVPDGGFGGFGWCWLVLGGF